MLKQTREGEREKIMAKLSIKATTATKNLVESGGCNTPTPPMRANPKCGQGNIQNIDNRCFCGVMLATTFHTYQKIRLR